MLSVMYEGEEYRFYDHLYAVSASGKFLRNLSPFTPLKRKDGYLSVGRRRLAHRVVANCWVDNPNGHNIVHHKNGDKSDNRASNLVWITQKEHMAHHPKKSYVMPEETKQKLREAHLGMKSSEATKQKQRETNLRLGLRPPPRPVGYKMNEAQLEKCRINSGRNIKCSVNGVVYRSFVVAAESLGLKAGTIRRRFYSKNFPEYKVIF